MHRNSSAPARLVLIAFALAAAAGSAAGCGPADDAGSEPPITIDFQRKELLTDVATLAIYFYNGDTATCADVRAAMPRPPSILGPYQATLSDEGRQRGITFTLQEVPAGVYLVFVDALDSSGRVVGTGCAPDQTVYDRQISRILISIS